MGSRRDILINMFFIGLSTVSVIGTTIWGVISTLNGNPLGNDMFIVKLEKLLGKQIKTLPRGRPRKR